MSRLICSAERFVSFDLFHQASFFDCLMAAAVIVHEIGAQVASPLCRQGKYSLWRTNMGRSALLKILTTGKPLWIRWWTTPPVGDLNNGARA
ncbi:hypothetical protein ABT061_45055 [Streptosporangium sp. NPDC002544]|uniref:hypothetical protein n=1 Tax=Streptosporangium sp. NPDC002544 TaxID=3154538 RepID=UPI003327DA59